MERRSTFALSLMMFLQFFLWGAWFVTLGPFMNTLKMGGVSGGVWVGNAYSTAPLAAIVAPFFLGVVADRFFASQRVMGVLHLLGNLLFLFTFGNAVNAKLGHLPFLALYFGSGAFAGLAWLLLGSRVPVLGASGAIMGITGAFLVLYPLNEISYYDEWSLRLRGVSTPMLRVFQLTGLTRMMEIDLRS